MSHKVIVTQRVVTVFENVCSSRHMHHDKIIGEVLEPGEAIKSVSTAYLPLFPTDDPVDPKNLFIAITVLLEKVSRYPVESACQ